MAINAALTSLTWRGITVPAVGSVSISISRPAIDITPIGTPTADYIAGISSATGTLDLFFDEGDAPHVTIFGDINDHTPTSGTIVITLESGTTITGNALVTGYEITAQAQNVIRATVQLQFREDSSSTALALVLA